MGTHNLCFYKENQKHTHTHTQKKKKKIALASLDKSYADLFLKVYS